MSIVRKQSTDRMSKIVIYNDNNIYLSGQVADDVTVGIQEQTSNCLSKIEALLAEAGSDKNHILSTTIYIKDMKDFAAMNEIWDAWVAEGEKPARACVQALMAREAILIEICVIATVK